MEGRTFESLVDRLDKGVSLVEERPNLLFSSKELSSVRERAAKRTNLVTEVVAGAQKSLADPEFLAIPTEPYYRLDDLRRLSDAHLLQPRQEFAEGILALLKAFCEAPKWVSHVHGKMKCDHCSVNTSATMVLAMEALGEDLEKRDEEFITDGIYERSLKSFLEACKARSEFWADRDHQFNWRIMTCGEGGLAALGLRGLRDREKMVSYALEGVADVLDRVPAEGDWEEGPSYWSGTLYWGLRFILGLKRLSQDRINLFEMRAFEVTPNYFIHVTQPSGLVFNYADCPPEIPATALHLVARERGNGYLAWTARKMKYRNFWDVLFDDPDLPSVIPEDRPRSAVFPTTGLAMARSDWSDDALYVGFKSGPTVAGHEHMDINSFVVSKGITELIVDSGIWPYAHFLGFGDRSGPRWDFDYTASIGHNTILVDGKGQSYGPNCAGEIVFSDMNDAFDVFISDGASVYPGLVEKFDRWLVYIHPDIVLVYDDLASDVPRYWEWLIHQAGTISGDRSRHLIENSGVKLALTRLMPDETTPWRNSNETRTSYYEDSNELVDVERSIKHLRLGPMFPSKEIEFLWAMHLGDQDEMQWGMGREREGLFNVYGAADGRKLELTFDRSNKALSFSST